MAEQNTNRIVMTSYGEMMAITRDGTATYRFESPPDASDRMVLMISVTTDDTPEETIRRNTKITVTIEY